MPHAVRSTGPAVTIDGADTRPTISGNHLYGIFDFDVVTAHLANLNLINAKTNFGAAVHLDGATVTLDHVHVSNSQAPFGGAIMVESGTLLVSHSEFTSNTASFGGAISQTGGSAIISSSSFTANVAAISGGGIDVYNLSHLTVSGSLFDGNSAYYSGGAVLARGVTVQSSFADSTFVNNQALHGGTNVGGGAIVNQGVLTLTNSTLTNNITAEAGGGLFLRSGRVTVRNSTLSGNAARGSGGGIATFGDSDLPAVVSLNNVTLSGNTADLDNNNSGDGGGLALTSDFITMTVTNSIVAGNFDTPNNLGTGTIRPDCSGELAELHFTPGRRTGGQGRPLRPARRHSDR